MLKIREIGSLLKKSTRSRGRPIQRYTGGKRGFYEHELELQKNIRKISSLEYNIYLSINNSGHNVIVFVR